MRKATCTLLVLMTAFAAGLFAQDHKIETGIISFNNNDFKKALDYFNEGMVDVNILKAKNIPRGYYYRAMTKMRLIATEGQKMQGKEATMSEAEKAAMKGMLTGAYDDFKNAKATDDGKWASKVDGQMTMMNVAFLQGGLTALNESYKPTVSDEDKKEIYNEVVELMNISIEIDGLNYFAYDLRAQSHLNLSDTAKAYNDFSKAASLVESTPPTRPDLQIGYIFYRKAVIERYHKHDIETALTTLDKGKKVLDSEYNRMVAKKADMTAESFAKSEELYQNTKDDLNKFELDLLLNAPDKLQQAIDKFKTATANEPKNYLLHVAYAQLLDRVGKPDEAIAIYEKATQIDPAKQMAWFNLGALYVNQAVVLYKEANTIEDYNKAAEVKTRADDFFRKAVPYLEKAYQVDNCDRETLKALLQITINLQMNDEYKKYKDKEKQCGGG